MPEKHSNGIGLPYDKHHVVGSSPISPIIGGVAQLVRAGVTTTLKVVRFKQKDRKAHLDRKAVSGMVVRQNLDAVRLRECPQTSYVFLLSSRTFEASCLG